MSSEKPMNFQFNIPIFLLCFGIGMLYVYLMTPKPQVIIKYPTPYNSGKVTYTDLIDTDSCFQFTSEQVECPADKSKIKQQPLIVNQ